MLRKFHFQVHRQTAEATELPGTVHSQTDGNEDSTNVVIEGFVSILYPRDVPIYRRVASI